MGHMSSFSFAILREDGTARVGRLTTPHGVVETPCFMPVGTQAGVKALSPADLRAAGSGMILANTYHLSERPGAAIIEKAGGLHRFMSWDGAILTDSGGFQVFSLPAWREITQDGVWFRSLKDGRKFFFSPESCLELQKRFGSDIAMVLDECPPAGAPRPQVEEAVHRTLRWAEESRRVQARWSGFCVFAIGQGGLFKDLREKCARELVAMDFPGYAVGGVSVGESTQDRLDILRFSAPLFPREKPRYLMGVGTPNDFIAAVDAGYDLMDCIYPTRVGRNGTALTFRGKLNLRASKFAEDFSPVEKDCPCETCRTFTRAYLHHLFRAKELLALRLLSLHNVTFMGRLGRRAREAIAQGTWKDFQNAWEKTGFAQ